DSADAFHWRGLVLYSMMLTDESIADYTRSLDLAKNDNQRIASFMNRGVSRLQKRDFQGGYEDFTRALFYKPDDIGIINNIATVLDELGRTDEAIKHLNRIVELDSTFIGSYINLGFQYIKLKRYKEAIAYFDKAIKLSPTEPLTWNNRGLARYYLNDLAGALQDINKSLSLYSQNSYAYKNRALVYLAQNKKDQACEDLRKALENGFEQMYGDEVSELIKQHCK
ncbi:MAG TPA: tetratricopeptide repeat protein, partial [Chitinophagaceae bacterium]|nr:tetratricopeptide repeat protein [Chitinophagaceae bacterium]